MPHATLPLGALPRRTATRARTSPRSTPAATLRDFAEIVQGRDIVDVTDSAIILADSVAGGGAPRKAIPNLAELGSVSPSPWTAWLRREYNPELRDLQGLRRYDEMRRSDSTVRGTLRLAKTPVLSARWFVEPASQSKKDKKIAEHIWWNLTSGMTISFGQVLKESLLMLDYGYYMFEKVFTNQNIHRPGMVCWQKIAPRHPMDVVEWSWDSAGGPDSVEIYSPVQIAPGTTTLDTATIPIDKLLVFSHDKEAGDLTGMSLLRSAYKPWYYKSQLEKIDAIQKERHGIGVPIITLPANFSEDDKRLADQVGRNLRTNERAHVVLPPGWVIEFAKLQGQLTDALKSIQYHNTEIAKNILATFMEDRAGVADANEDLFLKSCRDIANEVENVFNLYAIPQLVDYNFSRVKDYPKLQARRIGEVTDWRTLSFALRNVIGAGIVVPDDPLEELIRDEMDMPPIDEASRRAIAPIAGAAQNMAKQPPTEFEIPSQIPQLQQGLQQANSLQPPGLPHVGLPRQAPPSANPAARNTGTDRSGG